MAINFIKNIIEENVGEYEHSKFTRYGKGVYSKEETNIKVTGKNITIKAGPEFVDVCYRILAENATEDVTIKGKLVGHKGQESKFEEAGIGLKATRATTYTIEDKTFTPEEFKKFVYDFKDFFFLIHASSGINNIKSGKSVPKPGNVLEKFTTVKFDKSLLPIIKEEFMLQGDEKEYSYRHEYNINDIVVDQSLVESNPLQARLQAKRKGTLKITQGDDVKEYPMEV